ncbi:hypothetical protein DIQ79_26560 [Mycolicibacterium smegmatis]|uniref:Uncharacterized protein n=1 Tax=Mycolicibacterium smegmatis (strain ATCC 700084 / mc(2)155) TaxID=246196 RepID=A0QW46_MYCS2|nr:hypothetical protein MSMEG_2803 [Mycolicibacterium smegmatis MC2 155]TBM43021.1 hypothetical protein DIQ86_19890 [Mycolicibacterium smegmatis]TBH30449.1 hypothetical protein EYS45_25950 [Mycolicibacterium smegmatis MC2 155]TBM47420.1 hypothetical protein DIQ85_27020 [Mycolicibacterium smegmatis]TBM56896.1 hypothetical protein DIQ83_26540 [Mycolicibacterium smegmatis]
MKPPGQQGNTCPSIAGFCFLKRHRGDVLGSKLSGCAWGHEGVGGFGQ